MLTLDQTLALINAGYTKEEIEAFKAPDEQPAEPATDTSEETAPKAPEAQPSQAEPAPAQNQDAILQALERLTNSIMQHNTNGTVIQPAARTPEDALAEIIAPPRKNK